MKITVSKLKEIINEEIAIAISPELDEITSSQQNFLVDDLSYWLGSVQCCRDWFHGAHHTIRGATFAGDHVNVFGHIYSAIEKSFDSDAEKAVGITNDINVACPLKITECAIDCMKKYPSPCTLSADDLVISGLAMINDHILLVEDLFKKLESTNSLTLGLNDHLSGQANDYETFVYLLQQRAN